MNNGMLLYSLKKQGKPDKATVQMNFKDMLNKISQTQKDKYCVIPLI